ncbi:MAG: transglycosylase SLT domain-containing protein [Syntrophobacteraceae bacterium]|jgi:LysM repeat protein|nr:transglycosylase SLT domain-containing protein [Syntrophobacteraceae bacterium]
MRYIGTNCWIRKLALLLIMAMGCLSCATDQSSKGRARDSDAAKLHAGLQTAASHDGGTQSSKWIIPYYPPPSSMDLCGESVPLRNQEVMERFDKEFTLVVYNHAQVYLWLKRMERYFPWIEERLRANGLPDDLKYVAIVESDLLPDARSPKGAAGPWQFMPATGSAYGLQQTGSRDDRYDFELATECAFLYLQDLYRRYRNWTVAIATYNCGDKRVQDQIRAIGATDYYQMRLPTETERYVFRILAVKTVLGDPARYGYHLPKGEGYPPLKSDRVRVQLSCPLPMQVVAEATGATVREIKRLNPAFRSDEIPEGSHDIKLPAGSGEEFEKNIDTSAQRRPADETSPLERQVSAASSEMRSTGTAREARGSTQDMRQNQTRSQRSKKEAGKAKSPSAAKAGVHTVKQGETLSSIARRYNVKPEDLRKANRLRSGTISSGQKLVIP